jgi:apolipoprotein D and lipocalin family protein
MQGITAADSCLIPWFKSLVTSAYYFHKNKSVKAEGKAKFAGPDTRGKLRVAYFLPIYLDYNALDVDAQYQYAMVSDNSLDYLWIIREKTASLMR